MLLPNLRFRVPHRFGSARCRAGTGGAKPRPSRAEQENPAVKIGREKPNKTPCGRAEQHPAPGWRESGWRGVETGGKVYGVGNNGFSWSTTPVSDSNNAYRSDFNPTWLNPQGNHYRAYAYQLRCLQEEGVKTVPKKTPAFKCRAARPRAAADTAPVCCTASATPGTSGRRRFRRGVAVPTTWTSTTSGSSRSISTAVRTVFSCVASRNRSRKTTAELCQEKPNPRVPSGTSRRPGWWRLARPLRVAISPFAAQLPGAPSEKLLRHTVIDRALGEILLEQLS